MSSTKKPKKNSESTFNFTNSTISESAVGPNATVNINKNLDTEKLREFSLKFTELQKEVNHLSSKLPQENITKVKEELAVVEGQIQKSNKADGQVVLSSLKEISNILTKAGFTGMVLKQLFDIAQTLFLR